MKFGAVLPTFGKDLSRKSLMKTARMAEDLGYDSIWTYDHIMMARKFAFQYDNILESLATLSFLAGATEKIKLGPSVLCLPLRNPVLLAKEAATLDLLSDGRLILGIGAGAGADDILEFGYLDADYKRRGRYVNESLEIMKLLWREDDPRFQGDFFKFEECVFEPKPIQKPHPPIWIGGKSEFALDRVSMLGDGWLPSFLTPDEYREGVYKLKADAPNKDLTLSCLFIIQPDEMLRPEKRERTEFPWYYKQEVLDGPVSKLTEKLGAYVEAGLEYPICEFANTGDVNHEEYIERMSFFMKQVAPSL